MECACCGENFETRAGGFKRIGIDTKFKGGPSASESLEKHFSVKITPGKAAFICTSCSLTIRSVDVNTSRLLEVEDKFRKVRQPGSYLATKLQATPQRRGSVKRQKVISTKLHSSSKRKVHATQENKITITINNSHLGRAVQLISQSRYKNGVRQLLENSKAARRLTTQIFCDVIRKEVCNFVGVVGKRNDGGLNSILHFKWDNIIQDAKNICPILLELLTATVTKKGHHKFRTKRRNRKTISLIPIIGSILMTMGYSRTTKCSMLQQMVSIMMWLGGCKRKVFGSLNRIGICQSAESTRRRLDDIKQDYDVKVKEWKDKLTRKEEEMGEADDTMSDLADLEDLWEDEDVTEEEGDEDDEHSSVVDEEQSKSDTTPDESTYSREAGSNTKTTNSSYSVSNQDATDVSSSLQTEIAQIYDVNRQYYFDITFDNVNQKVGVRHHVRGKHNTMLNMVQAYATLERIGSYGLSNEMPTAADIRNILLAEVLPSPEDEEELRAELQLMASRILTNYIPAFADIPTTWSIEHQHSKESAQISEIVPLGILNKDESSTAGMIEILEDYKKYVPEYDNRDPIPLVLFCDGLSCERMEGAQRARINGADNWARLNMFEPAVQEWHRRLMFVQDTYDELFKFESHREKGHCST